MKKRFLFLAIAFISLASCRKDDVEVIPEVEINTQNTYDDQAAQEFLQSHYFDAKGNLKTLLATDSGKVKLADLVPAPVLLPSGVIYLERANAQPNPGTAIGSTDVLHFFSSTLTYIATNTDGKVKFTAPALFRDDISQSGVPQIDPIYYYVKQSVLDAATTDAAKQRSYYEIEGLKEALTKFKAFNIPDESNYNLQGMIIVPSRAAFARDLTFNFNNLSYRDRSFVFNFQVFKTIPR